MCARSWACAATDTTWSKMHTQKRCHRCSSTSAFVAPSSRSISSMLCISSSTACKMTRMHARVARVYSGVVEMPYNYFKPRLTIRFRPLNTIFPLFPYSRSVSLSPRLVSLYAIAPAHTAHTHTQSRRRTVNAINSVSKSMRKISGKLRMNIHQVVTYMMRVFLHRTQRSQRQTVIDEIPGNLLEICTCTFE